MAKRPKSVGDVLNLVALITDEWVREWDAKTVRTHVHKVLNFKVDELIYNVLGISKRWDKWEVDHCNGRMSDVRELIKDAARDEAQKVLSAEVDRVIKSKKFKQAMRQAITADFIDSFQYELNRAVREKLQDRLPELVDVELNKCLGDLTSLNETIAKINGIKKLREDNLLY